MRHWIGGVLFPGRETRNKKKKKKQKGLTNCMRPVQPLSGLKRRLSAAERVFMFVQFVQGLIRKG